MANISAEVTYEEGVKKAVSALELYISAIPIWMYQEKICSYIQQDIQRRECSQTYCCLCQFNVVNSIASIKITKAPSRSNYYFFNSVATSGLTDRTLAFDPTGMEVTATYADGSSATIDNAKLKFSSVPALPVLTTSLLVRQMVRLRMFLYRYLNQSLYL